MLNQNKLEVPNFLDLKQNLETVLIYEGFKYVLVEESPIKPEDATDKEIKAYEMAQGWWDGKVLHIRECLAASKSVDKSAYDMLGSLKEMFGEKNRASKQIAIKLS